MRRKRRLWLGLGLLLLTALAVAATVEPYHIIPGLVRGETFYEMRPSSYWRTKLLAFGRAGRVTPSDMATFRFRAVPMLRECLKDEDRSVRWVAAALLGNLRYGHDAVPALQAALEDSDNEVRFQSIRALGKHGPNAFGAGPDLVKIVHGDDEQLAYEATVALWLIDPKRAVKACGWKHFSSDKWQFEVEFPNDPTEAAYELDTPAGSITVRSWKAGDGPCMYLAAVSDYTEEQIKEIPPEEWFRRLKDNVGPFGLRVVRDEEVVLNGIRGRDRLSEFDDTESIGGRYCIRGRYFWVGRRLYQITVTFKLEYVSSGAVQYFLDSFRIDLRPDPKP
jgi:HEAT repeats